MIKKLFPTLIYEAKLANNTKSINKQLLKEIDMYSTSDTLGQKWSSKHYVGGYTSYSSLSKMHELSPTFQDLENSITKHVVKYLRGLNYKFDKKKLKMTTCWMNIMPKNTYHTMHIHPLSVVSGTYYVQVPKGASQLKIEDTKMAFLMNAPQRAKDDYYYHFTPKEGELILFESWVRHEVPPNQSNKERVSISFNYELI